MSDVSNQNESQTSGVSTNTNPTPTSTRAVELSRTAQAYARREAEISAVPESEFALINMDVRAAVMTILGSLPEIAEVREDLRALPLTNQTLIDNLEDYALATQEAHARYMYAAEPSPAVLIFNERALELRETLRMNAELAVHHGLLDAASLGGFTGNVGYRNVANDVIAYASLLLSAWPRLDGRLPLTEAELLEAKDTGTQLVYEAGLKDESPRRSVEAARARNQAFTLMVRAYDEVRQAVGYARWKRGDADEIAPSLYASRNRRNGESQAKKDDANAEPNTAPPAPKRAPPRPRPHPASRLLPFVG
ncbi:MAG: hypothetical protein R3A78_09630 [Polyangiales bacterium]